MSQARLKKVLERLRRDRGIELNVYRLTTLDRRMTAWIRQLSIEEI